MITTKVMSRGAGKTSEALSYAHINKLPLVVHDHKRRMLIRDMYQHFYQTIDIITLDEFFDGKLRGVKFDSIVFDDIDDILIKALGPLCGKNIIGYGTFDWLESSLKVQVFDLVVENEMLRRELKNCKRKGAIHEY